VLGRKETVVMKGYVARKGDRYYAVIYGRLDPLTGRERRRWHPAGTCETQSTPTRGELAAAHAPDQTERSSLTVAVYLTQRWLPMKKSSLRASTWDGHRRVLGGAATRVQPAPASSEPCNWRDISDT
jgi:hypothetical protein